MRVRASFALLLFSTGCTTTYVIPKTELSRLDGFVGATTLVADAVGGRLHRESSDVRRLRDSQGQEHLFSADTPLVLVHRNGETIAERFLVVDVDGQRFRGVPDTVFRSTIELPLNEVESAGVREFSLGKTLLLGTSLAAGLTAAIFGMAWAIETTVKGGPNSGEPCPNGCEL